MNSTGTTEAQARSAEPRRNRIGIGKIVVLSLGVGLAAAVFLPFIPWPTVDANFATAMVLLGFALGWALLAALSVRLTDQPQRWAYAPAVFMGVGAVLLLFLPDAVLGALDWGEFFVVPRGVEHRPVADQICEILLLEPTGTLNTGDAGGDLTSADDPWI
jgi:hypothetical protein